MPSSQVLSKVIDTVFNAVKVRAVDRTSVDEKMTLGRGGLGLDSVDILEIVVAIEHEFQVRITDKTQGQAVFQSLGTIAEFVESHSPIYLSPMRSSEIQKSAPEI